MSINWRTYTGFSIASTCLPCCVTCPACFDVVVGSVADPTTIAAFKALYIRGTGDWVYGSDGGFGEPWDNFAATGITDPVTLDRAGASALGYVLTMYLNMAGGTLDIDYALSISTAGTNTYQVNADLYSCDDTFIQEESINLTNGNTSETGTFSLTVPSSTAYILRITVYMNASDNPADFDSSFTLSGVTMSNVGFCYVASGPPPPGP